MVCRFCDLWRPYSDAMEWDAANAPFAPEVPHDLQPWTNIAAKKTRVPHAGAKPATRCARAGVPLDDSQLSTSPRLRRMQWLHIPKAGTSFGTTLVHYGCPRIPRDAAADEGAPIVSLTKRFPRGKRRWCDANAFVGNLNGHAPLRYPRDRERGGHVIALFREPAARLASECAAIDVEFRRAFADRPAAPPERRRPRRKGKRAGHAAAAAAATSFSSTTATAASTGGGDGDDGRDADADADAGWEWAPGSVYADTFLRTFLLSHGFSHAAIAALTHAWNDHGDDAGPPPPPAAAAGRPGYRRITPAACASLPGWRGCQTKMLLGLPCAAPLADDVDGGGSGGGGGGGGDGDGDGGGEGDEKPMATTTTTRATTMRATHGATVRAHPVLHPVPPLTLNASHVAEAVRRIEQDIAFVGLTERFDESVCLFHRRFGGRPVPAQFVNVRPMVNHTAKSGAPASSASTARRTGTARARGAMAMAAAAAAAQIDDPWDTAVHAAARARFERDLQAAGL